MTFRTLILRSLRFHARAHLGVLLGAAVGSAALIGALVVGDSVRGSLHDLALQRLGNIHYALAPNDRFFRADLATRISQTKFFGPTPAQHAAIAVDEPPTAVALLRLPATASAENGTARANHINILGVPDEIWKVGGGPQMTNLLRDSVALNEALATQLGVKLGDTILLRVRKPTALSQDAVISPRSESSVALRLNVQSIVPAAALGNFNLNANQIPPLNAFVRLDELATRAGIPGRANLLLNGQITKQADIPSPVSRLGRLLAGWAERILPSLHKIVGPDLMDSTNGLQALSSVLAQKLALPDFQLEVHPLPKLDMIELRSSRIFLDRPIIRAAHSPIRGTASASLLPGSPALLNSNYFGVLTYFANEFRVGDRSTPYSMVTAAEAPIVPQDMKDDEILINEWLAEDLQAGPGTDLDLSYFLADSGPRLIERTNHFHVRAVVPMTGLYADRTLMPEFPGLAKAESTHDWDAGFPLVHTIRDKDEAYWKQYRGTPKAFVSLAAGQKMWANRFGDLTAIRFRIPGELSPPDFQRALEKHLLSNLKPEQLGLRFDPVRAQALAAASQSQDFGQLFLGFSFFLIVAALILMALLFQFSLEQRTSEIGTLLALGFTPKQVRRLLMSEGTALAFLGGVIGVFGGIVYSKIMLGGLTTVWRGAVGTSALQFYLTAETLVIGLSASVAVSGLTIWLVLRKQARRPARELLMEGAGGSESAGVRDQIVATRPPSEIRPSAFRLRSVWLAAIAGAIALTLIIWALWKKQTEPETFFSAGSLFLTAGLGLAAALFSLLNRSAAGSRLTVASLGLRGCTRRRKRSLAAVGLLACGSFLIAAIGAFKLDANANASQRASGTGGFAALGASALPVAQDLNTQSGRELFGLDAKELEGVSFVPFRVRDGDDASCLNLNRAQTPRLLGVNPQLLQARGAFTFAKLAAGVSAESPWLQLQRAEEDGAVPAIGDLNSILWALGKKVGDTLSLVDEHGGRFNLRLIGGLANSILQGNLIISEEEFLKRFPGESGYRMFLIDMPSNNLAAVSATLTRSLQDIGFELTPASRRLAAFNAVQNTYLNTFQVLGGLGLLLGSAGLGVIVLRNVLERRGELALLQAVGFRRRTLQWLVLSEHGGLLALGLAIGILAALIAILPVLLAPGAETHFLSLGATLVGVFLSGLGWTWLATKLALHGELLKGLRQE